MGLKIFSIMRLDTEHIDEICMDIERQKREGISDCALFMMTLVPEGDPPIDKAKMLCEKYKVFKERLDAMDIKSGVLVQATIGHGWVLSEMFPYQQYTAIDTGEQPQIVCPYDEGFREYIKDAFKTIALCHPDMIMLDDDFRLMSARSGGGCGCPLHIAEFNRRADTLFTREELNKVLHQEGEDGDRYNRIFTETQREALISCAKIMRQGIDEVDPELPGSFCCVGNNVECAEEIAHILAGEGNPSIVRINNGNYTPRGTRYFSDVFLRAAQQVAKLEGKVDYILAETDTCPQNRYSTSAMSLHTHFTGSLLEGANGAKHWITRLHAFEPESGEAYRKILSANRGFYDYLADIYPRLVWRGCRIPMSDTPRFDLRRNYTGSSGWSLCVLEWVGLPFYFSAHEGGIVCLEGNADLNFSDEEILELLKGPMFLASDTAKRLVERGFGKYLGVDVKRWEGLQPSVEKLEFRGNVCNVQYNYLQLISTEASTREISTVYHTVDKENLTKLFPGVTFYQNTLGGKITVFCGTPNAPYNLTTAFSFLNLSRKMQLIGLMQECGELPVYYPGDAEIYLKAAEIKDEPNKLFIAVYNLGFDPLDKLPLKFEGKVLTVEKLMPNGNIEQIRFDCLSDGSLLLNTACKTLDPVILTAYLHKK